MILYHKKTGAAVSCGKDQTQAFLDTGEFSREKPETGGKGKKDETGGKGKKDETGGKDK